MLLSVYSRGRGTPRILEALVDTGAACTVISRALLGALGCQLRRTQRVILGDGRIEEWTVSEIEVECEGRRTTTPILMGPPTGPVLLGSITLEALGLGIDPVNGRLVAVDLYLAICGCTTE